MLKCKMIKILKFFRRKMRILVRMSRHVKGKVRI